MFSFHLVRLGAGVGASMLMRPPRAGAVAGLRHAETMATMRLGAPVVSPHRLQVRNIAVFARWESEGALEDFLATDALGQRLADAWHVRLDFVRRWGSVDGLHDLPETVGRMAPDEPVVAVTLARHRLPELARFIRWGRPVERQVRDHPASTLALAAVRPPRTFSTFSIWESSRAMTGMVFGRRHAPAVGGVDEEEARGIPGGARRPDGEVRRHAEAMAERERRDFHREFTTLRFRPLSEHGSWQGRSDWLPT